MNSTFKKPATVEAVNGGQVTTSSTEDILHKAAYRLRQIITEHSLTKSVEKTKLMAFNPLSAELNPICHLLALLGTHHILHVSRIRVNGQEPVESKIVR